MQNEARDFECYRACYGDFANVGFLMSCWNTTDKMCVGTSGFRLDSAKRLRTLGLVRIDDSPQGPLVYWDPARHARYAAVDLLAALTKIAAPDACGCQPCTGQCRSQEALEVTLGEIRDVARAAIAAAEAR